MKRVHVERFAEKVARVTGLDSESVYEWLMDVGRDKGRNPCKLQYCFEEGRVWVQGEKHLYRLERYQVPTREAVQMEEGPDYEGAILARQERLFGDW